MRRGCDTSAMWAGFASDPAIDAALEPVKLFEGTGKGGREVGSRFVVQPLGLD
jgi:hypothetical protein